MKRTLLSLIILFIAASNSFAQDNAAPKIGGGFDVGIPVGPASSTYEVTGGVTVKAEFPVATQFSITATTGFMGYVTKGGYSTGYYYNSYDGSGSYSNGSVASFIPLEAGARFYVSSKFYVEGDLGASFNINSNSADFTNKKTALIYAPMAGMSIPFGASRASVDVSLRYESRLETGYNYSQIAARAVFNFSL
ncbi:MAG TPA: hypothetical protein VK671_05800 [Mucilaginibacter sp.]|jgi:hypothetical protein|nr:hypothetical protein [Mucilaginibacter sp.]